MFADEVKTEAVNFLYSSDILYNRTPAMITEVSSLNVCDIYLAHVSRTCLLRKFYLHQATSAIGSTDSV